MKKNVTVLIPAEIPEGVKAQGKVVCKGLCFLPNEMFCNVFVLSVRHLAYSSTMVVCKLGELNLTDMNFSYLDRRLK